MVEDDRRDVDGRRKSGERRVDTEAATNWPKDQERRSNVDRRALDRRKKCMHCGQPYTTKTFGQPSCACRLRAIRNPGIAF